MSTSLLPTTSVVGEAWLALAAPAGVRAGRSLPEATDQAFRDSGFVRVTPVGGNVDRDVPFRSPVVAAECWFPPDPRTRAIPWDEAEQLANQLVAATFDPRWQGVLLDLPGEFGPALVHTVIALGDPARVTDDPRDFARFDIDLQINWTGA